MEGVAVVDHASLDWCRRCDAVGGSGLYCGARRSSGRCGRVSNNRDADIDVEPESSAVGANLGVPCVELGKADRVLLCNGRAVITILDKVESIAVVGHARLDGCRSLNAVGGCWNS